MKAYVLIKIRAGEVKDVVRQLQQRVDAQATHLQKHVDGQGARTFKGQRDHLAARVLALAQELQKCVEK